MLSIVILAAGKGTRMNDVNIPKVCRSVGNLTMIERVVNTAKSISPHKIILVVSEENKELIEKYVPNNIFVIQKELSGTCSAVLAAKDEYKNSNILVLLGDVPLLKSETLKKIINLKSNCVILGFQDTDPNNRFGRIVLENNKVVKIVEYAEASEREKEITSVNSGILYLDKEYTYLLNHIDNKNSKKEYYLTDIVKILQEEKIEISYLEASKEECMGANTPKDLEILNFLI